MNPDSPTGPTSSNDPSTANRGLHIVPVHNHPTPAPDNTTEVDVDENTNRPGDRPEWPRWANNALNQLDTGARRALGFVHANPEGAARLVFSAIGAVAIGLLGVVALFKLMQWAAEGNPLQDLAGLLPARELVSDPLMRWLSIHTAGTGISTETAAWTWGIAGAVVWFFACSHQLGAQLVAWPAYGAATAAMAWFGTTTATQRPIAAGLVAIAWTVLSLFALNRRPRPRPPVARRGYLVAHLADEETTR
jgi:hypothetical protein